MQSLVLKAIKKEPAGSFPHPEDYSMVAVYENEMGKELRVLLSTSQTFASYQFHSLNYLILQRTRLRVKVKLLVSPFCVVEMVVKPVEITCGNLCKKILKEYPPDIECNSQCYALFLPSKNIGWQVLDANRPVLSYGITSETVLEFGTLGLEGSFISEQDVHSRLRKQRVTSKCFLYLIIDSPAHGVKSTYHFDPSTKVSSVYRTFIDHNPVSTTDENLFCLWYRPQNDSKGWAIMDPFLELKKFGLRHMDVILFAKKNKTSMPPEFRKNLSKKKQKRKIFGVDPADLPLELDGEYHVPEHLMILKQQILANEGLHTEGLFRMAGSEPEIMKIKKMIETSPPNLDINKLPFNLHNVCNVLKRWYCEMPNRIFSHLPSNILSECAEDPSKAASLPAKLPQPYRDLYLWFISLLVDIAMEAEHNKMTPHNLAISVAPIFLQFEPGENPMDSLMKTQRVVTVLESTISTLVDTRHANSVSVPTLRFQNSSRGPVIGNLSQGSAPKPGKGKRSPRKFPSTQPPRAPLLPSSGAPRPKVPPRDRRPSLSTG